MDLLTAFKISISGVLVVFLALGLICLCIKIFSTIILFFSKPKTQKNHISEVSKPTIEVNKIENKDIVGYGELKLFDVDEKTAAMIMAIVSDESKIPLAELQFKSIRAIEN